MGVGGWELGVAGCWLGYRLDVADIFIDDIRTFVGLRVVSTGIPQNGTPKHLFRVSRFQGSGFGFRGWGLGFGSKVRGLA